MVPRTMAAFAWILLLSFGFTPLRVWPETFPPASAESNTSANVVNSTVVSTENTAASSEKSTASNVKSNIDVPKHPILKKILPTVSLENEMVMPQLDLTPTPPPAHDPKEPFTLKASVSMAVHNFPAIRAAVAKLETAEKEKSLAKTSYLPKTDFFYQNTWGTGNQMNGLFVPMPGLLPVAGGNSAQSWQNYWGNYGGILTTWNAVDFGYRKALMTEAKLNINVASAGEKLTEFDVAVNAANSFLRAVTAQKLVKTAEADFERSRVLLTMVSTLVKAGLRPGADQSRVLADVAQSETQLIHAKEQASLAKIQLANALGLSGEEIEIAPETNLTSLPGFANAPDKIEQHPELLLAASKIKLSEAKQREVMRSALPKINLVAGVTSRGSNFGLGGSTSGGALQGTYPTVMNYVAGVTMSYSPFDLIQARIKKKIEGSKEAEEKAHYEEILQQLKMQNAEAQESLNSAMAVAKHTPIQVEAAKAAEVQVARRYKVGLANLVDVAEAQRLLTQAEIDDSVAKLGVWSACLGSAASAGDLQPFLNLIQQNVSK